MSSCVNKNIEVACLAKLNIKNFRKVALIDSSKFRTMGITTITVLRETDTLITDRGIFHGIINETRSPGADVPVVNWTY